MGKPFNFNTQLEKDVKEHDISRSGYFKIQEGDNRVRILSEWAVVAQHFMGKNTRPAICYGVDKGCPHHAEDSSPANPKWMMWVLDYKDSQVKLAKLPYTIVQSVGELQKSDEYGFEEVPMPYDITIRAKDAGTKEVEYTVIPARQNTELPDEVFSAWEAKKGVKEIVETMKEKARRGDEEDE